MANDQTCSIQTHRKSDGKWYYVVVVGGEAGVLMGPHENEEEAIAAGEKDLHDLGLDDDD
ncbi:MAG: hypothetical protein ACRECY_18985 [Phyllobacterium sp.]